MNTAHPKNAKMMPKTGFSANSVMRSFVALYYQIVECMPNRLSEMYGERSSLRHGLISATGTAEIAAVSCRLPLSGKHVEILSMNIQDTACGFVILVHGSFDTNMFSQVFVLEYEEESHNNHFVCRNDIFRFLPQYNMFPIRAHDLIPLSKFMSLYPGRDEPLVALTAEGELPPTVVAHSSDGVCPPEYVPITYGPLSKRESETSSRSSPKADQNSDHKVIKAVSNAAIENEDGDQGSSASMLANRVPRIQEDVFDSHPSLPLSDVTIDNEESSKSTIIKTDEDLMSFPASREVSHDLVPVQSNRLIEPVASVLTFASPKSTSPQKGNQTEKKDLSTELSTEKHITPSRAKRRSHADRKRNGRIFGPTAVVRLRALRKPLDIKELISNLRHEFSKYGYAVRRVDVKMRMGLAFVGYDSADGVDAAVAAWKSAPPNSGKFAGVNLSVFAKKL